MSLRLDVGKFTLSLSFLLEWHVAPTYLAVLQSVRRKYRSPESDQAQSI